MAQEPERKKKCMEQRRKKLAQRRSEPKHHFSDPSYMEQIQSTEDNIDTALKQGLQAAASSTNKRALPGSSASAAKKQKMW